MYCDFSKGRSYAAIIIVLTDKESLKVYHIVCLSISTAAAETVNR